MSSGRICVDFLKCDGCGKCAEVCPKEVFDVVGQRLAPQEVFKAVELDETFYRVSGGGITVSGGEPLLQVNALLDFLRLCKARQYHVALETSAALPWETHLSRVLPFIDLYYIDLKASAATHKELTGVSNRVIIQNIKRLQASGKEGQV